MFLLASSDAPDRRDASDPEEHDPEAHDREAQDTEAFSPGPPAPESPVERPSDALPPPETPPPSASVPETGAAAPESEAPATEVPATEPTDTKPTDPAPTDPVLPAPEAPLPAPADSADSAEESSPSVEVEPQDRPAPPVRPVSDTVPPSSPEQAARSPLQRAVLAVLFIAAAALIGYVLSRPSGREADSDALVRSLEAAGRLQLQLETDTPAEARRYIRDEFGWRVGVPVFETIPLRGVAIGRTAPAVEVPVFLYADDEGRNVAVFAYSYALLDQVPDRLRLTAADYDELDEGSPFVRRANGNEVVLWRDRDDIYIAVTDLPPEALINGFAMAR